MSENAKNSEEVVDDKKADSSENDKSNASVDNNSVNNKSEKAGNTKATTNSAKSNDDTDKNAKKTNDDSVEPGKGTALGEIPKIEKYIVATRIDGLQTLYQICFQSVGKTNVVKKHLRQFDGFDFEAGTSEFKKRVESTQKLELAKLKSVCEGLQLDKKGPKDAISQRIVEFLVAPHKIDAPTDDEEEDDEDEDEEEAEEEEEEEVEVKSRSKGRGNARNASSKAGRPRRSTAGRGGKDTSAYVEYSSSSDEGEKSVTRAKPVKRRRDDSDSGSDYNPSGSGDSDAGKKAGRFSGRGRPQGSRRSARRRRSTSEEEESSPTSDEDFSDEPKRKKAPPTRVSSRSARGRGRKPKESEESEVSEDDEEEGLSEPESDQSEGSPKRKAPAKNSANNKSTPQRSKRAAVPTKPLKDESSGENESEDDEPLSKKAKPLPPTDDEIKKIVEEILKKANLEEITMKTVCRSVYSKFPDLDLTHKKEFIKTTVKSLIST